MSDSEELKKAGADAVVRGDAPRPDHPVTNDWTVVARGLDGRYRTVVTDPQKDIEHALHLAEAYTTPGDDRPDFEPDARVVRDGAVVGLIDAVEAFLAWADHTGSTGDIIDLARHALRAAVDPTLDIGEDDEGFSLAEIREISFQGEQAFRDGLARSSNPYPQSDPARFSWWDRGWELTSIAVMKGSDED